MGHFQQKIPLGEEGSRTSHLTNQSYNRRSKNVNTTVLIEYLNIEKNNLRIKQDKSL